MLVAGLKAKKSFSLRVIAHNLFHGQRHDINRFTFSGYLGVHLALARSDGNLSEVDSGRMARPNCDELIIRSRSHLLKWLIAEALCVLINPAEHLLQAKEYIEDMHSARFWATQQQMSLIEYFRLINLVHQLRNKAKLGSEPKGASSLQHHLNEHAPIVR